MPATTRSFGGGPGTPHFAGENLSLISSAETNQLKATGGRVAKLITFATGTPAATIDVYDHASSNTNKVFSRVISAAGVTIDDLSLPMQDGIRIVTTTMTTTSVSITWT